MLRPLVPLLSLILSPVLLAGCRPVKTAHQFELSYPRSRSDFATRFLGLPSGHTAVWFSTADDGEPNSRYEGYQVVVDPGSPADVESTLLPYLAGKGLKPGLPLAYILLTSGEAQSQAGADRLAREYPNARIVAPPPRGRRAERELGGSIPEYLGLGSEITSRAVGAEAHPAPCQSFLVRFVDVQFLFLPALEGEDRGEYLRALGSSLSLGGVRSTVVFSPGGLSPEEAGLFGAEVVIAPQARVTDPLFAFAPPEPGKALEITTNGSEMALSALARSRYGHWIDCGRSSPGESCAAELPAGASDGAVVVSLALDGQAPAPFVIDTRAPFSYLVRSRFERIPGAERARLEPDEHGGEPLGLLVPGFPLGPGPSAPVVHGWRVLPIDPFTLDGTEMAGVIGMDLLQSFKLTLIGGRPRRLRLAPNFAPERESLSPAEEVHEPGSSGWDVPMDHSPAGPLILSTLDGRSVSLVVDLASPRSLVYLPPGEWSKRVAPAVGKPDDWSSLVLPQGELSEAVWKPQPLVVAPLPVADLNLFGAHFPEVSLQAVDAPLPADLLGMDFLGRFKTVTLDFRRRSLLLER